MNISRVSNLMFCANLGVRDYKDNGKEIPTKIISAIYPVQQHGKIEYANIVCDTNSGRTTVKVRCDGRGDYDALLNTYNIARQIPDEKTAIFYNS